jgi:hypothetical protein
MSAPSLPDFGHTVKLGGGQIDAADLAEAHGLLCGLVCRGAARSAGEFLAQAAAMRLVVEPAEVLRSALADAWEKTLAQLEDEYLGFQLWLPDDEEPLEERTIALGQWCSGFLAGLGSGGQLDALSDDAREAIEDLQQIARAEMTAEPGADDSAAELEADEAAFAEIVEYVRVVALTMREDFRGPAHDEAIH